jgi:hypothetical protein
MGGAKAAGARVSVGSTAPQAGSAEIARVAN